MLNDTAQYHELYKILHLVWGNKGLGFSFIS